MQTSSAAVPTIALDQVVHILQVPKTALMQQSYCSLAYPALMHRKLCKALPAPQDAQDTGAPYSCMSVSS